MGKYIIYCKISMEIARSVEGLWIYMSTYIQSVGECYIEFALYTGNM